MQNNKFTPLVITLVASFTILMIGLAIFGAYQSYSPVPVWDMWDGAIHFFLRLNQGETGLWWAQHNEHRILLTRLLFWIDLKWFAGSSIFLIIVNYIFVGLGALLFWRILGANTGTKKLSTGEVFFGLLITSWLFLWSQSDNFVYPFQSEFFLAQFLPLCAFYWLYKSTTGMRWGLTNFLIACGFGILSIMTMANGIFALPLMTLYAIVTRQSLKRILCLVIVTIICLSVFLHGYHAGSQEGSFLKTIQTDPISFFTYILFYLGNPFYYLLGSKNLAAIAGLFLILNSIVFTFKLVPKRGSASLQLAILLFIVYIEITAICTGCGRFILGLDQALSSRYTTPSVMAWAALLVLYLPYFLSMMQAKDKQEQSIAYGSCTVILMLFMLHLQFGALMPQDEILFKRKIAALALELGVNDPKQIEAVYPPTNSQHVLSLAKTALAQGVSVFTLYPFSAIRPLGSAIAQPILSKCQGDLNLIEPIDSDGRFLRVSGWLAKPASKTNPQMIQFVSSDNRIIGYAFTEKEKSDLPYSGYLLKENLGINIVVQSEDFACQLPVSNQIIDTFNDQQVSAAKRCEGYIDTINNLAPSAFTINNSLHVSGWLVKSIAPKVVLHESILLVLTDSQGKKLFVRTRSTERPDVSTFLKKPRLIKSGFTSDTDVSKIHGNYTLGLAYTEGDLIKICPQFNYPGSLNINEN